MTKGSLSPEAREILFEMDTTMLLCRRGSAYIRRALNAEGEYISKELIVEHIEDPAWKLDRNVKELRRQFRRLWKLTVAADKPEAETTPET